MGAVTEELLAAWQAQIRDAAARGDCVEIRGGGSKAFLGEPARGAVLDTRAWRGVVSYEPTELVITVRAGTPLAEVEAVLAERNQMLAFEPPHFGNATVGGMVAAGLSGPRRASAGAVRDHVLGISLLDGRGELLRFGGQVMKNVAGYDVSRLMCGAMGCLGLLLDVSLKVLPRPALERTVRLSMTLSEALQAMNRWGGEPLPISATCWVGDSVYVRLSGAHAAVDAAVARLKGDVLDDAAQAGFWLAIREQTHPFFSRHAPLWRLSVPSVEEPIGLPGEVLLEWGGALRWVLCEDGALARERASKEHGSAMLFRALHGSSLQRFDALSPASRAIHQRLKQAFDPARVFNRGRMYPDW
ncbi:glycolate oxidase subunit GlcE [Niveibacterium sp. 24ML]|uniref:glycolate oxidase subunit GlcE n=1 Tax=Niveibacterium sp. 24ML TaxID=2985512 RepID=UPI00226E6318|nr:glycolate oxidase subunit GlcE [Niveibacterium sp. 24ML]MCX9156103.1 glycolate oxidase subunit GlcE [Niveibacterium sp. 24ML]